MYNCLNMNNNKIQEKKTGTESEDDINNTFFL